MTNETCPTARDLSAFFYGKIDDETFEEKRAELFELLGLEIH